MPRRTWPRGRPRGASPPWTRPRGMSWRLRPVVGDVEADEAVAGKGSAGHCPRTRPPDSRGLIRADGRGGSRRGRGHGTTAGVIAFRGQTRADGRGECRRGRGCQGEGKRGAAAADEATRWLWRSLAPWTWPRGTATGEARYFFSLFSTLNLVQCCCCFIFDHISNFVLCCMHCILLCVFYSVFCPASIIPIHVLIHVFVFHVSVLNPVSSSVLSCFYSIFTPNSVLFYFCCVPNSLFNSVSCYACHVLLHVFYFMLYSISTLHCVLFWCKFLFVFVHFVFLC